MKPLKVFMIVAVALTSAATAQAGTITVEFQNVDKYTDFSVSGLSEEKTLGLFESELEDELKQFAKRYIVGDHTLEIVFIDIDMAGDIQPWRNSHNADIRYIERIYPPRMELGYTLKGADGTVISEGTERIADIAFDFNILAPIRSSSMSFFYEITLLEDWIRKNFRSLKSEAGKN
jgi:hypothetical protein